jgi:hypothetical protein
MSKIEASRKLKMWKGSYDFAVDGGAVSTITLRSDDGDIPNGSVILGGYADVQTILASSGSATAALQAEAANDVVNAAAFGGAPWSTTVFHRRGSNATQAASLTQNYSFAGEAGEAAVRDLFVADPLPVFELPAGARISTVTVSKQAGDNYGAPKYYVEEFDAP